jgi:hypothetical protein
VLDQVQGVHRAEMGLQAGRLRVRSTAAIHSDLLLNADAAASQFGLTTLRRRRVTPDLGRPVLSGLRLTGSGTATGLLS